MFSLPSVAAQVMALEPQADGSQEVTKAEG